MIQPGRKYSATDSYRYGFNGKENDNDVKGEGLQLDYGFRIYDPRLAKFLSVDPLFKSYPWFTPYQFAGNGPILNIDLDGLENSPAAWNDWENHYTPAETNVTASQGAAKPSCRCCCCTGACNNNTFSSGLRNLWRGTKDGYKATANSFSKTSIRNTYNDAKGTAQDFGNMLAGKPGAGQSFGSRLTTFSNGIANSITEPSMFLATMYQRSSDENMYGIGYYGFQATAAYAIDRFTGDLLAGGPILKNRGKVFNHFTNIEGVTGITGINIKLLDNLKVGESITVKQLSFKQSTNTYMLDPGEAGNFVTDYSTTSTKAQLERGPGVFGDKQNFAISFDELDAFEQGARVKGKDPGKGIYVLPANVTLIGTFKITKTR